MNRIRQHAKVIRDRHRIDIHDAIRDGVANCNRCDHSHPCPDWQHAQAILNILDAPSYRVGRYACVLDPLSHEDTP